MNKKVIITLIAIINTVSFQISAQELNNSDYRILLTDNNKYVIANKKGQYLTEQYDEIQAVSNLTAIVRKDSLWAIARYDTDMSKLEFKFSDIGMFSEGIASFSIPKLPLRYGYIDSIGCIISIPQYAIAEPFHRGLARVTFLLESDVTPLSIINPIYGKSGYIDRKGEYAIKPIYSFIDFFFNSNVTRFTRGKYNCSKENGCYNPYPNSKWGLIDISGSIILEDNEYDFIDKPRIINDQTFFGVEKKGKFGVINSSGHVVLPLKNYPHSTVMWSKFNSNNDFKD